MTSTETTAQPWWWKGAFSATLLILFVFAASLAADKWVSNSQLTLPLLLAAVVSMAVAGLGIPRLKALKMGQVIREEGPSGHQSKSGTPTMGGLLVVPVGVILGSWITREPEASQLVSYTHLRAHET